MSDNEIVTLLNWVNGKPPQGRAAADGGDPTANSLVFDDEPMEAILYGQPGPGPTIANAFGRVRKILERLKRFVRQGALIETLGELKSLAADLPPLSLSACRELTEILSIFIPCVPCPILRHDIRSLEILLEGICEALSRHNTFVLEGARTLLFRCHEHLGNFESARRVLQAMAAILTQPADRMRLACNQNNLGFEYLLERRWSDALPYFERAAALATETGDRVEAAVMRSNYWSCRVELDGIEGCDGLEAEAGRLRQVLEGSRDWRVRKVLILQARIMEHRGKQDEAINLVLRAIAAARNSETRWPEIDGSYLEHLSAARAAKVPGWRG